MESGFVFCAAMGQFLTQNATTDVLTHMYQLSSHFNTDSAFMPWYMASFGLSVGTIILVAGRYGDVYGMKKVILGGYVWTVVWSILCGISWYTKNEGPSFYVCARCFQGVGLAFILPNVLGAVGRVYTPGTLRKKIIFGVIGYSAPLGGFAGIFMSGVIGVRTDAWYWNYYAFAILTFLVGCFTYICMPEFDPQLNEDGSEQGLDLVGSVLAIASMVLFNFAWNQAPIAGWDSGYIIAMLVVGFVLFPVFAIWEIRYAKDPLLPPVVMESPRLVGILLIIFVGWGAFGINIYHTATLLLEFRHYSVFATGAMLTPAPVMGFIAAFSCAILISRHTVEWILLASMLSFTVMSVVLATAKIDESYFRNTLGVGIIAAFGMDWSFPAASIMLSEELPKHYQGMAGSLVTVMMNYGISIFLGFAGTVEEQLTRQRPDDTWRAWRGAMYFSIGISGLGAIIAAFFVVIKYISGDKYAKEKDPVIGDALVHPDDLLHPAHLIHSVHQTHHNEGQDSMTHRP